MKISTRAAPVAAAFSLLAAINPVATLSPEARARPLDVADAAAVSAPRYHRHQRSHQRYKVYYARPYYYRPYPYSTPVPFVFGFNFGPSWW